MLHMSTGFFLTQFLNMLLISLWFGLPIAALYKLSKQHMKNSVALGWAALIVIVPVLGAVAFLMWTPPKKGHNK